jgi:hypothetical protein
MQVQKLRIRLKKALPLFFKESKTPRLINIAPDKTTLGNRLHRIATISAA